MLDDMGEEDVNLNESENSSDEDAEPDLEGDGDDADWVPSRGDAEGDENEEEATAGPSTSQRKAAGQPRGSVAPRGQGGGRGRGRGRGQDCTDAEEKGGPWLDEGTEDHMPPQPNFWPSRTPGPQIKQGAYTTLQLFRLFFTNTMLRTVVRNTNKYGAIHHADRWTDITLQDLFSYMSMLIYMGLTQLPALRDYWRRAKPYNLPFPKSVISRPKFQLIATAIHMSDPDDDATNEARRGTAEYDCLQKIKPMYTELRDICKKNFHPYQHIRVDERGVSLTRQARVQTDNQYKWGYKLFVLADSRCGYTWDFYINEGRSEMVTGKGLSYDSVMELVSTKVLGSGYKLYVDNFYNSPELFKDLLQQKVWACGTVRNNNKGFPTGRPGSLDKKSPRGSIRWIREDPLLFVQWKDKGDVQMCSTMHQAHAGETVQRKLKGAGGEWSAQDIPFPPAVKDYNKHMGGADFSDVLIGHCNKSRKWYRTLFFHFIHIAIVNAFILHKEIALSKGGKPKTQKAFREALLMELSAAGSPNTVCQPSSAPTGGMQHLPVYRGGNATQNRRRCTVCKEKTPILCEACETCFCMVPNRNCFSQWHRQNQGRC